MSYCNNQSNIIYAASSRKRQTHTPWFWLLLTGGSILLHLILIKLAVEASHNALSQKSSEAAVAIDWVELPNSAASSSSASQIPAATSATSPNPSPASKAPTSTNSASTDRGTALKADLNDIAAIAPSQSISTSPVSTPAEPEFEAPALSASPGPASMLDTPKAPEYETPVASSNEVNPSPLPSPSPDLPDLDAEQPDAEQLSRQFQARQPQNQSQNQSQTNQQQESQPQGTESQMVAVEERPLPLPNPSPLIVTQQIDVPVPDVTETFSTEADQQAEAITEEIVVPSELTASLTATLPETDDLPLDEAAYPKQEVQTFAANSSSSPCVMSPEAVPFLGKTVEMEVMTDELGQVVDTVTQESSQNPAYDELATCLVKNWEFEPAIARGQPVATDGLVVRITIEADG